MSDAPPSKPHVRMRKGTGGTGGDGGEAASSTVAPSAGQRAAHATSHDPNPPLLPPRQQTPRAQHRPASRCRRVCVNVLLALPIAIGLALYNYKTIHDELQAWRGYGLAAMHEGVSDEVLNQFRMYDVNGDGYIDPYEFDQLIRNVNLEMPVQESFVDNFVFNDTELEPGKEVVTVRTMFEPLVLETMVKFQDQQQFLMGDPGSLLPGLYKWKQAHLPTVSYGAGNFRVFLPSQPHAPIGVAYPIIKPISLVPHVTHLHMNRYSPPIPEKDEEFMFSLLSQFHPNVFLQNRFGPRGGMALVRARNNQFLDIMMRIHAEYQLNKLPNYPFWFTPGQFSARVIMDREATHVEYFELYVPTNRKLNIDMEWVTGPGGSNEVDIGYIPEMRLRSAKPSSEFVPNATEEIEIGKGELEFDPSAIQWDEELSIEQAKALLEQSMYPFKKIPYLRFSDAVDLARETNRLVHFILLWGALDDQSC